MAKDFNTMTNNEKDKLWEEIKDGGPFKTDFIVEGKKFSEMSNLEKKVVWHNIEIGNDVVSRDTEGYDERETIGDTVATDTPYGILTQVI